MILYLVWDSSGSMAEWGKNLIARGVARTVEQYLRLGYGQAELKLISWRNEVHLIDWQPDQEFPSECLVTKGIANVQALISFIESEPDGKILILSDGFWSSKDSTKFKRWKRDLPLNAIRIIKIGADANAQLKGDDVFDAENLITALDRWLEGGKG
ncbi:MAG: VWA domain-containing protein [bacterium]